MVKGYGMGAGIVSRGGEIGWGEIAKVFGKTFGS